MPSENLPAVLVVENDQITLLSYELFLSRAGYPVRLASSWAEAEREALAHRPEIVITDLGLSDGDGLQLIRSLRQHFPVKGIALTGHSRTDAEFLAAGFSGWLSKPVDSDQLLTIVRRVAAEPMPVPDPP